MFMMLEDSMYFFYEILINSFCIYKVWDLVI